MLSAATIFLSAFLLFGIQPLIARQITPWFGGSAAVWTTCMLFFQVVLLLGYFYAHLSVSHLTPRRQARLHQGVALLSLLSLPIIPGAAWKPAGHEDPTLRVLLVLLVSVGLPYWTLSTTNPLLSAWFSRRYSEAQSYRLFALSNLGALLALLGYPAMMEPNLTLKQQAYGWSAVYVLFVVLVSVVAHQSPTYHREEPEPGPISSLDPAKAEPPNWIPLGWIGLSACSSVLLIALTNYLTQNVAAIPFLWIAPLALYLLSYILCFSYGFLYQRWLYWPLALWALNYLGQNLSEDSHNQSLSTMIPLISASLFILCMLCHGELARSRPGAARLTQYYLMTSVGGALGGLFVGIISPLLFSDTFELPLALGVAPLLAAAVMSVDCALTATLRKARPALWLILLTYMGGLSYDIVPKLYEEHRACKVTVRNFYGPMKVVEVGEGEDQHRRLTHGTIQHGSQFVHPKYRRFPTTYYSYGSGIGKAITQSRVKEESQKIGIVGLGTGTVAAYGRPGDEYIYYELNPLVETLARKDFYFLGDNPAKSEVVLGDARLSLERESPRQYDVLAVDAFSSDSIPIHLLTQEALAIYFRHLKPGGILATHISNRYLDLQPVLRSFADRNGKVTVYVKNDRDYDLSINRATWVLMGSPDNAVIKALREEGYPDTDAVPATFRVWTDDYSNLLSVLDADEWPQFSFLRTPTPSPTP